MEQPSRIRRFTLCESVQYERQAPLNDQASTIVRRKPEVKRRQEKTGRLTDR
jgi:hypothetical protein